MKTKIENIVNLKAIGGVDINRVLNTGINDYETIVVAIDFQGSFLENGELPVTGSFDDVRRFLEFSYRNVKKISRFAYSLDTHLPKQIFFPCWWKDKDGNEPAPFTEITAESISNGFWEPVYEAERERSIRYVENLKKSNKSLIIWPYHCIQGTKGAALDEQVANMINFHAVAKKVDPIIVVKGLDPLTEMYGIFQAEDYERDTVNLDLLTEIAKYQKIIIAGEAASHCVMESVVQMVNHYANQREITSKIYVLEDCMSSIGGFEDVTKERYEDLAKEYGINLVKSTELTL
jgi:nicotinamidase-related amidase